MMRCNPMQCSMIYEGVTPCTVVLCELIESGLGFQATLYTQHRADSPLVQFKICIKSHFWGAGSLCVAHIYIYIYTQYVCIYMCIYIYIYTHIHTSVYLYLSLSLYIYIYMHYIHIYTHTYVLTCRLRSGPPGLAKLVYDLM